MALLATTVWEVRTTGNDLNGGGYSGGGTDWSQQDTPQYSVTDAVTNGTTTITSATASFGADVVGNILYIQGGTGSITAGWYRVVSFTNSTTIVVDRATGLTAGTGATLRLGGAMASPGRASSVAVAGNLIYIKSGTYSLTTATLGPSGPPVVIGCLFVGYSTNRTQNNTDTKPVMQYNASTITWCANSGMLFANLAFDGNAQTSARLCTNGVYYRCSITGMNTASTAGVFIACSATANSAAVFVGGPCVLCEAYANTATPFSGAAVTNCLSYGNTGATTDGFLVNAAQWAINCSAYNNGRDGFRINGAVVAFINCHAESSAAFGFNLASGATKILVNCSGYNNASGDVGGNGLISQLESGTINVTAGSAFTNAAGSDFSLNNTAARGALLRAAAFPGVFPAGITPDYQDIGAAQHQDPAGGGGMIMSRVRTGF